MTVQQAAEKASTASGLNAVHQIAAAGNHGKAEICCFSMDYITLNHYYSQDNGKK